MQYASPTRHQDTRTLTPESVKGSKQKWRADLSLNYFETNGNVDMKNQGAGLTLFRDYKNHSIYLKGNYEKSKFFDIILQDKKSFVLRYDFDKVKNTKWFIYSTYGDSVFSKLDSRITLGFGRWIDLTHGDFTHGLSIVLAREHEKITNLTQDDNHYRWAIRDLASYEVNQHLEIGYDFFFIPKLGDFQDHRIFLSLYLQNKISENISTKFSLTREYDSRPPIGVEKEDTQVTVSLVFQFGK